MIGYFGGHIGYGFSMGIFSLYNQNYVYFVKFSPKWINWCANNKWENLLHTRALFQLVNTPTCFTSISTWSSLVMDYHQLFKDYVYTNHTDYIDELLSLNKPLVVTIKYALRGNKPKRLLQATRNQGFV